MESDRCPVIGSPGWANPRPQTRRGRQHRDQQPAPAARRPHRPGRHSALSVPYPPRSTYRPLPEGKWSIPEVWAADLANYQVPSSHSLTRTRPFADRNGFCNLYTIISTDEDVYDAYTDALCTQIRDHAEIIQARRLRTIYIGGGILPCSSPATSSRSSPPSARSTPTGAPRPRRSPWKPPRRRSPKRPTSSRPSSTWASPAPTSASSPSSPARSAKPAAAARTRTSSAAPSAPPTNSACRTCPPT
ncbi:hypothetical protein SAVIM40S_00885 [Streptomyces avidinii]